MKKLNIVIIVVFFLTIIFCLFLLLNKLEIELHESEFKEKWKSCNDSQDCVLINEPGCCTCGKETINSNFLPEYKNYRKWNTGLCFGVACTRCPQISKSPVCVNNKCELEVTSNNSEVDVNLSCFPNETLCVEPDEIFCTDLMTSKDDCGECGHGCEPEQDCIEGTCTYSGEGECGILEKNTTWFGEIYVDCDVKVPEEITLTIEPGTVVKFDYDRNYKTFDKSSLEVLGGTIIAKGTKDKQIWFTSAAEEPINGDWGVITIENSYDSIFDYVIVEFGEIGIMQYDSSVPITNSIIRWNNAEGLYAERSNITIENNLLYGNGYHEIALEQYNNVKILNNIIRDGHSGIHHEKTISHIEGNCIINEDGISGGMGSTLEVRNNFFLNVYNPVKAYDGSVVNENWEEVNYFNEEDFECPKLDFKDIKSYNLGYIPGDPEDRYLHVYDNEDETRRVLKKLGKGLRFGWALEYVDDSLYRFTLDEVEFVRINPKTGAYKIISNDEIMNPRGLTHDGQYFYVNDFSLLQIFKFVVENDKIKIVDSFDIPEKEKGGTSGLSADDTYLYLTSRDKAKLYKLDKQGKLVDEIYFDGAVANTVWTGEYFWSTGGCEKGICKFTKDGKLVGEIYPPAHDTWAITWDGKYLWTIQRTCEMWDDPKIYKIDILDDSIYEDEQETKFYLDFERKEIKSFKDKIFIFKSTEVVEDSYCVINVNNENEQKINLNEKGQFRDFQVKVFDASGGDLVCGVEIVF